MKLDTLSCKFGMKTPKKHKLEKDNICLQQKIVAVSEESTSSITCSTMFSFKIAVLTTHDP